MEIVIKDERVEQENIHAVLTCKCKDSVPSTGIAYAFISQYAQEGKHAVKQQGTGKGNLIPYYKH